MSVLLSFLYLTERPLSRAGVLVAEGLLTTKKVTAVTTERLSGEARLVYIWLIAPGWFERLGAIVYVMCWELCREEVVENVVVSSSMRARNCWKPFVTACRARTTWFLKEQLEDLRSILTITSVQTDEYGRGNAVSLVQSY